MNTINKIDISYEGLLFEEYSHISVNTRNSMIIFSIKFKKDLFNTVYKLDLTVSADKKDDVPLYELILPESLSETKKQIYLYNKCITYIIKFIKDEKK